MILTVSIDLERLPPTADLGSELRVILDQLTEAADGLTRQDLETDPIMGTLRDRRGQTVGRIRLDRKADQDR